MNRQRYRHWIHWNNNKHMFSSSNYLFTHIRREERIAFCTNRVSCTYEVQSSHSINVLNVVIAHKWYSFNENIHYKRTTTQTKMKEIKTDDKPKETNKETRTNWLTYKRFQLCIVCTLCSILSHDKKTVLWINCHWKPSVNARRKKKWSLTFAKTWISTRLPSLSQIRNKQSNLFFRLQYISTIMWSDDAGECILSLIENHLMLIV